jgi:hypothetical protein
MAWVASNSLSEYSSAAERTQFSVTTSAHRMSGYVLTFTDGTYASRAGRSTPALLISVVALAASATSAMVCHLSRIAVASR